MHIQWNPSCEATPFALEKWPFKRGGLLSGVEINTSMFRFTLSSGLSRGGGFSKRVQLYNQSITYIHNFWKIGFVRWINLFVDLDNVSAVMKI